MTADQKRVHLALLGIGAAIFNTMPTADPAKWRLIALPRRGDRCLWYRNKRWYGGQLMPMPTTRYTEHPLSDIPDELLDRLDLSLVEQFLSIR